MERLTVKEAIEQGYTKYGIGHLEWQTTNDLHDDLEKELEEEGNDIEDIVLSQKESSQPKISIEEISELLAERISENDFELCARDDEAVYDSIKKIDFSEITNKINTELGNHKYWIFTDIGLKKDH